MRRKSSDERQIALALEKLHQKMSNQLTDNDLDRAFENERNLTEDTNFSCSNSAVSYGHSLVVPSLNVIAEGSSASDTDSDDLNETDHKAKHVCTFADVVLKLLKKKKVAEGYHPVETNDDNDTQFENIKIDNISDIAACSPSPSNRIDEPSDTKNICADNIENNTTYRQACLSDSSSQKHSLRPEVPNTLALPKIVLSRDTNISAR